MDEITGVVLLIVSVLIGGALVTLLQNKNQQKIIKILLALSGGFLIAIAFIHFIPEIYFHHGDKMGYFILIGFFVQIFLEYFSGGIEHGHIHANNKAGVIPWGLFISLSIHSIIEGIPLETQFHLNEAVDLHNLTELIEQQHHHHHHHHGEGKSGLLLGIILHKFPVAIALMTLMLASGFSKIKAWIVLFIFSLMSPLGVMLGHFGAANLIIDLEILFAVVVGMFLHISTTIIFETSDNHRFNAVKLISLLAGVGMAVISI
jgi:zinc transporter ZupT